MKSNRSFLRSVPTTSMRAISTRAGFALLTTGAFLLALAGTTRVSSQNDGMVVDGLRGSIPVSAVVQATAPKMNEFIACARGRATENEMLSGTVVLGFVIALDGSTRVTRIVSSDVGDREAERCMTRIADRIRFARPTGGEAFVTTPVQISLEDDVRPPIAWPESRVRSSAGDAISRLASRCRVTGGSVRVTAYVGPGGRFIGAGGFASVDALDPTIQCVVDGVRRLSFPTPGSYPAKVSFVVGAG